MHILLIGKLPIMGTLLVKHFCQSYFNTFKRLILHKNYTREHEPMSQGAVVVLRQMRNVTAISWRKNVTFHEVMVIMSALSYTRVLSRIQTVLKRSSLRQQSVSIGGRVTQLGHNILTNTTSIFAFTLLYGVPREETHCKYTNSIVFSSGRPWINPRSNERTRLEASALTIISPRWSKTNCND